MALDITKIRNIGFVGHGGVGKTSLVEAILFAAGATTRIGRVDDGTTTTDFDPDEIKRKISLNTSVAFCDYKGHRLNLVDTPGYGELLAEAAAETDDDLLAKYLEEGSIGEAEMLEALRKAVFQGTVVPVLAASATRGIGVQPLLDLILKEFPSPADPGPVEGVDPRSKNPVTRPPDPRAPLSALVFKTISDPHVGRLTLFRVYSGTIKSDSPAFNSTRDTKERVGHLGWLQGKTQKPVEALGPGEIGVVAKLKDTLTGDTLSDEAQPVILPGIAFPEPAIAFPIQPKSRGDEDKISTALHRMTEEDPTLHHHFDPETKQLLVSGIRQPH